MRRRLIGAIAGLALVGASVMGTAPAMAADGELFDVDAIQAQYPTTTKSAIKINGSVGGIRPQATVILDGTLSGYRQTRITPPGGTANDVTAGFSTRANWGSQAITTAVLNGSSYALWKGTRPARASSITLNDKWWSTGVGVTAQYPGGNVKISGTTITASNTANNTNAQRHQISGMTFRGALITVNQEATGIFRFGSSTFSVFVN